MREVAMLWKRKEPKRKSIAMAWTEEKSDV